MPDNLSILSFSADRFARYLADGFNLPDTGDRLFPTVVVADNYLNPKLTDWNRKALETGCRWLLVRGSWVQPWVGPIFEPYGPCYICLRSRLAANAHVDAFIQRSEPGYPMLKRREAKTPGLMDAAAAFVRIQIALQIRRLEDPEHAWTISEMDMLTRTCMSHVVVKRPQCPACGQNRSNKARPVVFRDRFYTYKQGGERRAVPPVETWKRYKHCISSISGIVTSLVSKTPPEDTMIYSYAAGHSFPVMTDDIVELKGNMRHRSGGKGTTATHARTGALCEAIERYSGLWQGSEPVINSSYNQLRPDAIEINDILLFSNSQYASRRQWNKTCKTNFQLVPQPLDPEMAVDWIQVWSLGEKRFRMVPAAYCYYGQRDLAHFFCSCDSNGNAAGNTIEEAVIRGFMELVERDAVAIWWYNRLQMTELDMASFDDPYIAGLSDYYASIGRQLWALDLTNDLCIPVVAVISRCVNHSTEDIIIGFAADLDIKTALLKAVNEVGQFIPALSTRDSSGNTKYFYDDQSAIDWWQTATVDTEPYLLPSEGPVRKMNDFTVSANCNQKTEVETCMELAADCGIDILVLDQTRPDIGLPVVKVIAPGMRHFWKRLAPGRLYDVPVKLGYLNQPLPETGLNPIPMFF